MWLAKNLTSQILNFLNIIEEKQIGSLTKNLSSPEAGRLAHLDY